MAGTSILRLPCCRNVTATRRPQPLLRVLTPMAMMRAATMTRATSSRPRAIATPIPRLLWPIASSPCFDATFGGAPGAKIGGAFIPTKSYAVTVAILVERRHGHVTVLGNVVSERQGAG